jgi:dTDP-4-dehydrorhamnose reductase
MNTLIVGAAGQVGRALLRNVPADVSVVGVSRAELDITDATAVQQLLAERRPHCVINAAAYTAVDKAESERDLALAGNVHAPRILAEAIARIPECRLVHISTDFVFDGAASSAYLPDSPVKPLNVYGATKLAGEEAVRSVLGERAVVMRTAWVYSAQGRNFLTTMLRLMAEKKSVRVVADQVGTPTSADSLAGALWICARTWAIHGIHHWTDYGVASWYDFAQAIAEEGAAAGMLPSGVEVQPITSQEFPTPAKRPAFSVLDKRATVAALGIHPVHWRVALRAVLQGFANA